MPKRPRQSDNRAGSGKRRKVDRVQCPFRVYAREHGLDYPEDHCKEGQTFKGNEKLNEHLDRYHSLRYWCLGCKNRFRFNSRDDLAVLKSEHVKRCTKRPQREHEKEWARYVVMSSEQYSRWSNKKWKWNMVDIPRLEGETTPRYSWRRIYKCLFPETAEFPDPFDSRLGYPTRIESMSPQPLCLLPSPRDTSGFETDLREWRHRQTIFPDSVVPSPSSESTPRPRPQLHGGDTGSAVNLSPGQRPRNTSPGPEIALLPGQTDRSEAVLQFQGYQRTLSECSDVLPISATIGTRRSGNANQVNRRDSPLQRPRASPIGLHGLGSFRIISPTHSPAISPRILPEPRLPPMVKNKSELKYAFKVNAHNRRNPLDLISDFQGLGSNSGPATSTEEQFPRYPQKIGPEELLSDSGYGGLPKATVGIPLLTGGDTDRIGETWSMISHTSDIHPHWGLDKRSWSQYSATQSEGGTEHIMCPSCHMPVKNKSELNKHHLRHSKPFVCDFLGCTREVGFSTKNDLARHKSAMHEIHVTGYGYSCNIGICENKDKIWPREDNFRSHLRRVHNRTANPGDDFRSFIS